MKEGMKEVHTCKKCNHVQARKENKQKKIMLYGLCLLNLALRNYATHFWEFLTVPIVLVNVLLPLCCVVLAWTSADRQAYVLVSIYTEEKCPSF